MKFIFKNKHIKSCYSIKAVRGGEWKSPWVLPTHVWERGGKSWIRMVCNDSYCKAIVEFKVDDMINVLNIPIQK